MSIRRSAGKLSNLDDVLAKDPIDGEYGIGHTRWATHGRPTEENAHPHRDCKGRIVVVHNGIIENYLELKRETGRTGTSSSPKRIPRSSRTWWSRRAAATGWRAVRRALKRLRGLFALVLISPTSGHDRRPSATAHRGRRDRPGRVLRRVRHSRDPQPHARRRVSRRSGDGRHHAHGRELHGLRRHTQRRRNRST
jgi:hypothetical protein